MAPVPSGNPRSLLQKHFRPATRNIHGIDRLLGCYAAPDDSREVPPVDSWRYLQVIERDGRIQNSKLLERPTNAKQYYCKAVVFKGSTHFFLVEWRLQN